MLQSELESCKELQELEPENKCEARFPRAPASLGAHPRQAPCQEDPSVLIPTLSPGCLLTIILLMRALDPLQYEKETLQYFQTLKASWVRWSWHRGSPARSGQAADTQPLCSLLPARLWTQ